MGFELVLPLVHQGELAWERRAADPGRLRAPPSLQGRHATRPFNLGLQPDPGPLGSDLDCSGVPTDMVPWAPWCPDVGLVPDVRVAGQGGRRPPQAGPTASPTPALRELTGMSRRAWFSAFGRPFFFPSVLSPAGLPGSKQSGAWLGTVCPPRATGNPAAHSVRGAWRRTPGSLGGCTEPRAPAAEAWGVEGRQPGRRTRVPGYPHPGDALRVAPRS